MKLLLVALFLALTPLSEAKAAWEDTPLKVFLLAGQSNSESKFTLDADSHVACCRSGGPGGGGHEIRQQDLPTRSSPGADEHLML